MKELLHARWFIAFALGLAASNVTAAPTPRCAVLNEHLLPAASGGRAALCAAIEQATAARGLAGSYSVKVVVGTRSRLTADVTLGGGDALPAVSMVEMDRPIGKTTLKRFGEAVANHIASARR